MLLKNLLTQFTPRTYLATISKTSRYKNRDIRSFNGKHEDILNTVL